MDNVSGDDSEYSGNMPSLTDNGDGTVTDSTTGLLWQKSSYSGSDGWSGVNTYCSNLERGGKRIGESRMLVSYFQLRI